MSNLKPWKRQRALIDSTNDRGIVLYWLIQEGEPYENIGSCWGYSTKKEAKADAKKLGIIIPR
jgi:hypothetical protein